MCWAQRGVKLAAVCAGAPRRGCRGDAFPAACTCVRERTILGSLRGPARSVDAGTRRLLQRPTPVLRPAVHTPHLEPTGEDRPRGIARWGVLCDVDAAPTAEAVAHGPVLSVHLVDEPLAVAMLVGRE